MWCERRVKEASPTHSRLIYQPGTSLPPAVVHGKGMETFGKIFREMTHDAEYRDQEHTRIRRSIERSTSRHRRDRGIVGIGASSGSGHRRDRGIVGIGASSGSGHRQEGLQALEQFFTHMPADPLRNRPNLIPLAIKDVTGRPEAEGGETDEETAPE